MTSDTDTDTVASFRAAYEAGDSAALAAMLTPDAELVSPLSGRLVIRGPEDIGLLLSLVFATIRELRWHEETGDGALRVIVGDARVGPLHMTDAMVLDLTPDGRISQIRPHLRPWLAVTLFALMLGPRVARHPGLVRRALRRA